MKKLLLITILFLTSCGYPYSEGNRQGYLRKFSHKGLFSKTWEGDLVQQIPGVMIAEDFYFTVSDKKLVPILQDALVHQKKIEITYKEKIYIFPFPQGDTNYFITDVKIIE